MVLENWLFWRGCDADGVSICGTDADTWGKFGVLDLKWKEIFKYGCRRRKHWVLDDFSRDQVWAVDGTILDRIIRPMNACPVKAGRLRQPHPGTTNENCTGLAQIARLGPTL